MLLPLTALPSMPGIRHGFFTREGGVSGGVFSSLNCAHGTGDAKEAVDENLHRIAQALGASHALKAWQVHGREVAVARAPWTFEDRPKADAIVTDVPGLAIGVTTADCAPVLFADGNARVVSAAHAGWKGAIGGVLEATIEAMERLGAQRRTIAAAIGPCIAQGSYEVGREFYETFLAEKDSNAWFFATSSKPGHFHFNLPAYVRARLAGAGIKEINLLARDTCLEEDAFFSYRRTTLRGGGAYGCQFSAIALGAYP